MKAFPKQGTGVALVTPFKQDKKRSIDFEAYKKLLVHTMQQGGVDYLVLMGTTGEAVSLSREEKTEIIFFVEETIRGRLPIVIGIGGNNVHHLENDLSHLPLQKASALMLVTPYYNKPTQEGLYQYYHYAHSITRQPLLIYNVPSRTGVSVAPETTFSLAKDCERIIGIKEASTDMYHCLVLCAGVDKDFLVIAGNDALMPALVNMGMCGVISVCANAFPIQIATLTKKALKGNQLDGKEKQFLYELDKWCFVENNPAGIKYILQQIGIGTGALRLPLVTLSKSTQKGVQAWVKKNKTTDL